MTSIVSNGQIVPVGRKAFPLPYAGVENLVGPSSGYIPLLTADQATLTYEAMYRTQPYVYAAVNKIAMSIGRLPLKTYAQDVNGDRRLEQSNSLHRLLKNPYPLGSAFDLKAFIGWQTAIYGNALLIKSRPGAGATPEELWPIPWRFVQVVKDNKGILGYNIYLNTQGFAVDPSEVVHIRLFEGISPMESLRRTLALEDAALTWQGQSFKNGATMRGAFVTEQRLNDATMPRLRSELEGLYSGPENGGRFGVFDQGLKFMPMSQSAVDTELIAQRKLTRDEVAAAFDVPSIQLGIMDNQTYAVAKEQRAIWYQDHLGAKIVMIEDALNAQLVTPEPAWDGLFLEFNLDAILRPDPESRARSYLLMQQAGVNTVNERRRLENLPPLDDPLADTVLIPLNMQPVGDASIEAPTGNVGGQAGPDGYVEAIRASLTAEAFTNNQRTPNNEK